MEETRRKTPPVLNSRLIKTIDERNIFPENLAFDPRRKAFFLGSTVGNAIVRCSISGACRYLFANPGEQAYILGLKIDHTSDAIWATTNTPSGASLRRYNIETGSLEQTARLEGKHIFNDLALSTIGVVYVTDTSEGSVYQLDIRTNKMRRVAPEHSFTAANGIAISPDEKMIYVSAWGDGVDVIDLRSGSVKPLIHKDEVCLAFIDGLYAIGGSLIAIQNGLMLPRIVQFRLDKSGHEIVGMTTLERRNPSFDGLTTGALVGSQLYFVANPQIDKKGSAKLNPLQIFAVRVRPDRRLKFKSLALR